MENNVNEIILHNEDHVDKPSYENRAVLRELNSNKNEQQNLTAEKIFGEKNLNSVAVVPNKLGTPIAIDAEGVGSSNSLQKQADFTFTPNSIDVYNKVNTSSRTTNETSTKLHFSETNDSVESIYTDCNMNENTSNFAFNNFEQHSNVHDSFAYEPMDVDESLVQELDKLCIPSSTVFVENLDTCNKINFSNKGESPIRIKSRGELKSPELVFDRKSGGDHIEEKNLSSNITDGNFYSSHEESSSFASSKSFVSRSPVFPVSSTIKNSKIFPNSTNSNCLFGDLNEQLQLTKDNNHQLQKQENKQIECNESFSHDKEFNQHFELFAENVLELNNENAFKLSLTKYQNLSNSYAELSQEQNEASHKILKDAAAEDPTMISKSNVEELLASKETEINDAYFAVTANENIVEAKDELNVEKQDLENFLNELQTDASFTVLDNLKLAAPTVNENENLAQHDTTTSSQKLKESMLAECANTYSEFTKIMKQHELVQQEIKALELDKIISKEDMETCINDLTISTDYSKTSECPQTAQNVTIEYESSEQQSALSTSVDFRHINQDAITIVNDTETQEDLKSHIAESSEIANEGEITLSMATDLQIKQNDITKPIESVVQEALKFEIAENSEMVNDILPNTNQANEPEILKVIESEIVVNAEVMNDKETTPPMSIEHVNDNLPIKQDDTTKANEPEIQNVSNSEMKFPVKNQNSSVIEADHEVQKTLQSESVEHSDMAKKLSLTKATESINNIEVSKQHSPQNKSSTKLQQIEPPITVEEYATDCSMKVFTLENEFKTPFSPFAMKTNHKLESSDFPDSEFRENIILHPSDFDYLLTKGSSSVPVNRNSLLLRFDPLLGAVLPVNSKQQRFDDVLTARQVNRNCNQEALLEADEEHIQHKLINNKREKFDSKNSISEGKCHAQITQPSQKNISMSLDFVSDLEISAKAKNQTADIKSLQTTEQQYRYMMDDIENKIKNEVLKTEDVEKKLKDAELREEALIKRITEKDKMLNKVNGVIEAYEKAIAELVAEKEQIVQNYEKQLAEARADRDSNYRHLTSLETTFSDLHVKYEKSKEMTQHLQANTEVLMEEKRQALENLGLQEQRYLKMKNHAMQQLEIANKKLESLTKEHSVEITKLKALLKKEEISRASINEQLQQKSRENNELMKICDELINGQGS